MIGGVGRFVYVLEGLSSEVHNFKVRVKAPFRNVLKEKYEKKYNDRELFNQLTKNTQDISIWCKYYNNPYYGSGLFLHHLYEAYKKQGYNVKIVSAGQKHRLSHYFSHNYGLKATNIDIREDRHQYDSRFQEFVSNQHDILSLDHTTYIPNKEIKREDFLRIMMEAVAQMTKEENTVYLTCLLFVNAKEEEAIQAVRHQPNVRFIRMEPDSSHILQNMKDEYLNVLIPHEYTDRNRDKHDVKTAYKMFPHAPRWVMGKEYYPYFHFVYKHEGKTGFHFMTNDEKKEN